MNDLNFSPIVGVSIIYDGKQYNLPRPNRHHHVIRMIAAENGVGIQGPDKQGFYNEHGHFLDRKLAKEVALWNNQCLNPSNLLNELYSEDLW